MFARQVQAGAAWPYHAIQLSTSDYVVSQYTSPAEVSVVGVDGKVVRSYGQSQTSDVGQMHYPPSLAVTKNDDILVADEGNNRILSINSSLGSIYKSCQLTTEYSSHGVCVWTSHEVDFMLVDLTENFACWCLMAFICDIILTFCSKFNNRCN